MRSKLKSFLSTTNCNEVVGLKLLVHNYVDNISKANKSITDKARSEFIRESKLNAYNIYLKEKLNNIDIYKFNEIILYYIDLYASDIRCDLDYNLFDYQYLTNLEVYLNKFNCKLTEEGCFFAIDSNKSEIELASLLCVSYAADLYIKAWRETTGLTDSLNYISQVRKSLILYYNQGLIEDYIISLIDDFYNLSYNLHRTDDENDKIYSLAKLNYFRNMKLVV